MLFYSPLFEKHVDHVSLKSKYNEFLLDNFGLSDEFHEMGQNHFPKLKLSLYSQIRLYLGDLNTSPNMDN